LIWWLIILSVAAALLLIKPTRDFLLRIVSRIRGFLNEVVEELKKVAWPSRGELKNSTGLVIFSMLMLMAFIGVVDVLLNAIIGLLIGSR
jgi:preprotein translocase subunit SecE